MGRRARNKQGEPEPLVKSEREVKTTGFKRSGGKRKPIAPPAASKAESSAKAKGKGKARADVEDEDAEDPTLRAARACVAGRRGVL